MRVEILRARVEMAKGSFANAEVRLKRLQPLVANDSVLRGAVSDYLTVCLTKTGRIDEIPRFAGVTEDNLRITYAQADAFVALGKYREALEIYEDIFQNHQGDLSDDGKREIPRKILDVHIRLQRSLPVAQRNWDQVNAMAKSILNGNMLNPAEKELFQIQLLERQERMNEARNLAERATQKFPEIRQFPLIVAELTPDHEQALKILDRLEQSGGDSPVLRIARGNRLAQQRPPELEQQLLGLLDGADKFDDESLILKQNIATLLRRSGFPMSAFTIWEGLLPSVQNRTGTLLLMFEIAEEAASLESMDKVMELLAQEPTGKNAAEWLVCEANRQLWLVETKQRSADDLSDIVRLLDKAKAERPEYAPIFAMEAEINVLQGKLPQAIELLETASRNRPGEIAYQQRLADLYVKSGRSDDARRILQQLPDSQKRTADVINEINSLLQQNPQLAVQRALDLFSEDSKKPEELMLLADVFRAVGETDRALPVIQRALKADMTQARPWLLFVQTLVAKGRTEDARKAVEELKKHVPADQQPLLLGQCYSTIRDFDSAEKSLSDAIATRPNDTVIMRNLALLYAAQQKNAELTKILEQMIAVTNAGDAESSRNVAWARRFLAQQLAATQSYGDFERARDLVEQNKDRNGALQGEDLALWLKIHAERPEAESRKKAVARLEELSRTRSLSANEDFIRAYIHYVEGKWPDARSLMPTVISKADGNTQFVVTFIEWLLEKNEVNDAKRWIGSLDQRSLQAIRFNAALMIKDGRASDAAKAIMARVPKEIDRPTAVALLEDLGKYHPGFYAAASQQWKLIVKESPNQVSAYIGYLTRIPQGEGVGEMMQLLQPRFDEAIQKKDAATAIYCINTAITALRNNRKDIPTSSPHYARVGQWMDAAKAAKFDPNVLVWSEVDFYDLQQQYEQLVTIYQDLLKRKDLTELQLAVIRNNLAFLYAISSQGERALEVIGDAISQLGPRSDFLDTRGLAHLSSGNVEAAVADLRKAVEGGQGDGSTFFHLALAESKSGNVPEAVAAIQEAIGKGLTEEQLSKPEATLFRNLMKELQPHLPAESVE
jgi:tetratricopeptide (TPR) repeat protein